MISFRVESVIMNWSIKISPVTFGNAWDSPWEIKHNGIILLNLSLNSGMLVLTKNNFRNKFKLNRSSLFNTINTIAYKFTDFWYH